MANIHILSVHEAQKIAAGEVIERPASVIKELMENALDAGATQITVAVEDGGKKLMRVSDNGSGMSSEDAHLCTVLHATSKIASVTELPALRTFGFRGEALAALAVASKMTIITKQADTHEGIKLTLELGIIIQAEPVAAQTGTIIEVSDLFYTIPARQKFLKKRETELRQIQYVFDALSLAHPTVHTKLYSDGTLLSQYPGVNTLQDRCATILQTTVSPVLLSFAQEDGHGVVQGVCTDHQYNKYDRTGMHMFVNKRWIKSTNISRAILKAYTNVLPSGRYPIVVIMLEVPGDQVDINVHPRKEEVQFMHPARIERLIYTSIHEKLNQRVTTLLGSSTSPLSVPLASPKAFQYQYDGAFTQQAPFSGIFRSANHFATSDTIQQSAISPLARQQEKTIPVLVQEELPAQGVMPPVQQQVCTPVSTQEEVTIIGQLLDTYILAQTKEGLLLIDQHAAHECILYNIYSQNFDTTSTTVQLLFPEVIEVAAHEMSIVQSHIDLFGQNGILVELFGARQVRVTGMPVYNKHTAAQELLRTVIALVQEHASLDQYLLTDLLHKKLRAKMACTAAVKAGDVLDAKQMRTLCDDLYKVESRLTRPHGRPTCWLISQYEIEKKFKRKL